MERMRRFFRNEGGYGVLEFGTVLGLVVTAVLIALFILNLGRAGLAA